MIENLHILLVGASGDIGSAMTARFLKEGAIVEATFCRHPDKLAAFTDPNLHRLEMDVTSIDSVKKAAENLFSEKPLDAIVYNSGITNDGLLLGLEEDEWLKVIDVNLNGAFRVVQTFGKLLFRRRQGKILFVSSTAASHGGRGQSNYAASKAGLEAMVKSLAKEMAPRNVYVNAIAPGAVESKMTKDIMTLGKDEVIKRIALGRLAKPEEIASLAAHLLARDLTYLTGEVIKIDGGFG